MWGKQITFNGMRKNASGIIILKTARSLNICLTNNIKQYAYLKTNTNLFTARKFSV